MTILRAIAVVTLALGCGHSNVAAQERPDHGSSSTSGPAPDVPHGSASPRVDSTAGAERLDEKRLHEPIDARVLQGRPQDGKLKIMIALPKGVGPYVVTDSWTGVFTEGGQLLKDTDFKVSQANGYVVWGEIVAAKLPSYTVRLFAPGYTH